MRDIAAELVHWSRTGRRFAMASVIDVAGSAPRPVGTALAVDADGAAIGGVSGGCVEGAVYELCQQVLVDGRARIESFGYSDEDAFAVGLTCGGTVTVFVTRIEPGDPALTATVDAIIAGRPVALARVISGPDAGCALAVTPDRASGDRPGAGAKTDDAAEAPVEGGQGKAATGDQAGARQPDRPTVTGDQAAAGPVPALPADAKAAVDGGRGKAATGDQAGARSPDRPAAIGNQTAAAGPVSALPADAKAAVEGGQGKAATGDQPTSTSAAPPTTGPDLVSGTLGDAVLDQAAANQARELLALGHFGRLTVGDRDILVESYPPPPRLLVYGAADFAAAVVRAGKFLGYRVTVCDARAVFATARRFPDADEVVVDWPHRHLETAAIDERTAVCVLTHDPKFDIPLLKLALRLPVGYVGAMGSRRTHRDRLHRLRAEAVTDTELARLHSPIGLDLGGRTPEETALSIAAEIVALRNDAPGGFLSASDAPIHRSRNGEVAAA